MESALEAGVELKKWGYQSSVLVLRHGGKTEKILRQKGIPVVIKNMNCKLPAFRCCFELIILLLKNDFSIIHCRCVEANFCGIIAAKITGKKCLIEEVGSPQGRSKLANWLLSKLYVLADGIIFVSRNVEKEFLDLHYTNKSINVIYNPIKKIFLSAARGTERIFLPKGEIIKIISAFRIEPEKNPLIVPEIALKLKKLTKNFKWDIYGNGSCKLDLVKKIKSLNLEKKIYLRGIRQISPRLLSRYHVMVLPSKREGMGIIVAEALALGLSVVASSIGGIPEVFDSRNLQRCLVKKQDPSEYAKKIILSCSPKFKKMFFVNRQACERFNPDFYKTRISALYDKVILA